MCDRPRLAALADRCGVLPEYTDLAGVRRETNDATRERLLRAFGHDASTEASAEAELKRLLCEEAHTMLAAVEVRARHGWDWIVPVRFPSDATVDIEWRAEFTQETGGTIVAEGRAERRSDHDEGGVFSLPIPDDLEDGYHELLLRVEYGSQQQQARQLLIVTPSRCIKLDEKIGAGRAFGVWTNLYSVRSDTNWGIGDLSDLRALTLKAGECGAEFVGVNPLHATANRDSGISPYSPVSRLFRNPAYIDIAAVPELANSPDAKRLVDSADFQEVLRQVRSSGRVDYERVVDLKLRVLRLLFETFVQRESTQLTDRGWAYRDFVARQGEALKSFATYMVSRAPYGSQTRSVSRVKESGTAMNEEVLRVATDTGFHCFVQFELDRQLAEVQSVATVAGMRIGLYNDLAIGSVADGADALSFPGLFVQEIEVGAPPDAYSAVGQKWGFPPVNPLRLRADRYAYWTGVLRASMAHAGMLRIDHVMGLFRQFWIPAECDARDGAYVRYPAVDLLGILALESRRHQTAIVGEDLGTVSPEVPEAMKRRALLSSRLLLFERESDGSFRSPLCYPEDALIMAANHDYPPIPGLWVGRDIQVREENSLYMEQGADEERWRRAQLRDQLLRALQKAGIDADASNDAPLRLCRWVYAFLAQTPSRLLAVSLDDLAGEVDPVNVPGVSTTRFPSWSRRMRASLSDIMRDDAVRELLELVQRS